MASKNKSMKNKSSEKNKSEAGSKFEDISSLSKKELRERARKFSKRYRVDDGEGFQLDKYSTDPHIDLGPEDKPMMQQTLKVGVDALADLQDILYAQDKWSLLLIFQAMDAAGKDGAIKHVMSGVNPQGCQVTSFRPQMPKSWTMITCGAARNSYRKEDVSGFLTVPIMRKYLWFVFMKKSLSHKNCLKTL